jgi:tetratricopeptide (TPR) repeat protein
MLLQSTRASAATRAATTRFAAALDRDPGLVLAHFGSGLCSYDGILNQWGDADAHAQALRSAAQRCLDLAPHAAEGYFLMGRYFQTRGDNAAAVGSLERAVGRNPSAAAAHALLAQVLVICGQDDEGLRRMDHATRLAPRAFVAGLAAFHFIRGDNERALDHAEQALLSNPHYTFARVVAAASAWDLGATDRAKVYAASLRALAPPFSPAAFLRTFGGSVGVAAVERIARALHDLRVGE